jgi:hypothetical protein
MSAAALKKGGVEFTNGKRPGASQCGCQEHKDPATR